MNIDSNDKIRVLLVNVDAGGGHKTLRDNFIRAFEHNPDIELKIFNSEVKIYQNAYKYLIRAPYLWEKIQKLAAKKPWYYAWKALSIIPDIKDMDQILEDFTPDIIINTNPISSVAFYHARKKYKLEYQIVTGIPDYGNQKTYLHLSEPADLYLVRNKDTRDALSKYISSEKLIIYGTSVASPFSNIGQKTQEEIANSFSKLIQTEYPDKPFDFSKKSILVIGGSSWANKSKSLIQKLIQTGKYNVIVACGFDSTLYKKLVNKKNCFPFPLVNQETLALIERFVDCAVLSSFAPATMHELFEINKYPLFVHNYIRGQETPHLDLLQKWDVGEYIPNDLKMLNKIEDFLKHPKKYQSQLSNMKKIRLHEEKKLKENNKIISKILSELA